MSAYECVREYVYARACVRKGVRVRGRVRGLAYAYVGVRVRAQIDVRAVLAACVPRPAQRRFAQASRGVSPWFRGLLWISGYKTDPRLFVGQSQPSPDLGSEKESSRDPGTENGSPGVRPVKRRWPHIRFVCSRHAAV